MKKLFLLTKMLLAAVLLCVGQNAWADATTLYERGTTNAWSDADLTEWSSAYCTPTISGGLSVNTTNAGWTNTKTVSVTENSIVTLNATLKTGGASGRSGSYDYVKIGGVIVGFNEQDKVAFVNVDGVTTNLSLTYTRNNPYDIQVIIDQATGAVSYTVGTAKGSSSSSTAITGVEYGHSKAGRENYGITTVLQKIEVSEEKQDVSTADYTINYIFNGATIKTVENKTAVGAVVNAENPTTIDDVRYFAKDGEETSMTIVEGTNVLNVDLRTAETFSYTVKAVDGSSNVLDDNLVSGSVTEGDEVTVSYPRWVLSGTTLYSCGTGAISYSTTFTPDADDYIKNITYNTETVSDVVFYTEGEDVEGVSKSSNARASKGQMGYTDKETAESYKDVTTLAPGKYRIYMRAQNGNAAERPYNFKVGENVVFTGSFGNGTNKDANSEEFTVDENSTLSFASVGSSASGIDYFYVVKIPATVSKTITSAGYATYCSPYALDLANATGLTEAYIVTGASGNILNTTSVKGGTIPANTGILLEGEGEVVIPVVASSSTDVSANKLVGVTSNKGIAAEAGYVLMDETAGVGFYQNKNAFTVGANTAYLPADFASEARSAYFLEGVTAVEAVEAAAEAKAKEGKFIENGKLVIVKNGQKFNAAGAQVK